MTPDHEQLQQAIAALEAQRSMLGDAVVDIALAPLRAKLAALDRLHDEQTPNRHQRKQVTVLFADISGFTAMSGQLDAEVVGERMNTLWQHIDTAITNHGGKIDKHIGDAVMALWGIDRAREDDPERAIRAALAMQATLADFQASAGSFALQMRIGINTGPVIWGQIGTIGELTALGDTVNLASRLEHAAPVGGILISHDTYRHVRGVFDVQPQAPISVKGKSDLLHTYIVERAKPHPFRVPTRGVEGIETRMIGREAELQILQSMYREAILVGEMRVVTLVGEAGVGKSRLLYEFDNWIELQPARPTYFKARATPEMQRTPYGLWRDLFRMRFGILDSDPPLVVLQKFRAGMVNVLDADAADVVGHFVGFDLSASPAVAHLLGSLNFALLGRAYLTSYFRAVASEPLAIFLEDIHWADDSTLDLLEHLVRELPDSRLLIVCPSRPTLYERRPAWGTGEPYQRVDLRLLSTEHSRLLVDEILQKAEAIPDDLRDLIVKGAEGNPYYMEELVKMLVDDGIITIQDDDRWQIDLGRLKTLHVPSTLTGVLQARLDSLPAEEKELLQRAAVVGRQFWDMAVAALHAEDDRELNVEAGLEASQRRELIFHQDISAISVAEEYIFKHALLRDVTYETVLFKLRRVYHAQVAAWIAANAGERIGEYYTLIAQHYELGDEPLKAVEFLLLASEEAYKLCAFRDSLNACEHALKLVAENDQEQYAEALIRAGKAYERLSDYSAAARYLEQGLALARKINNPLLEVEAGNVLGLVCMRRGQIDEARALGQETLMLARETGLPEATGTALTLMAVAFGTRGDFISAQRYNEEALALRESINNRLGVAINLNNLGSLAAIQGNYAQAKHYLERCAQIALEIGDRYMAATVLTNLASMNADHGEFGAGRASGDEGLRIRREIDDKNGQAAVLTTLGLIALYQGDSEAAQVYLEEALALRRRLNLRAGLPHTLNNLGMVALARQDYAAAQGYFEEVLEISRLLGDWRSLCSALNNLADSYLAQGEVAAAVQHIYESFRTSSEQKAPPLRLHGLALYARYCALTNPIHALEYSGLVLHHPATLAETKQRQIEPLLAVLRPTMQADTIDAALERGKTLNLDAVIAQILAEDVPGDG